MTQHRVPRGFSLIELVLVVALLGLLSAIAIPQFLGQRRRAQVVGDAQANARVISMALETRKADNGTYGAVDTYTWTGGTADTKAATLLPAISLTNATKMDFSLAITNTGLAYTLTVKDPANSNAQVLTLDQSGNLTAATGYK